MHNNWSEVLTIFLFVCIIIPHGCVKENQIRHSKLASHSFLWKLPSGLILQKASAMFLWASSPLWVFGPREDASPFPAESMWVRENQLIYDLVIQLILTFQMWLDQTDQFWTFWILNHFAATSSSMVVNRKMLFCPVWTKGQLTNWHCLPSGCAPSLAKQMSHHSNRCKTKYKCLLSKSQ